MRQVCLRPSEQWASRESGVLFLFTESGSGFWGSGAGARRLALGEMLVVGSGQGGEVRACGHSELAFSFFCTPVEHLFPLFSSAEIPSLLSIAARFNRPKLYPAFEALTQDCFQLLGQSPSEPGLAQRVQLLRVVAAVLAPQFQGATGPALTYRADDQMARAFERLSVTDLLTLQVPELAAKFNCSRRHLNRLFNEHFGLSVATLKMEMRLLKAASLLRNPETKIINVAEQCGFNHLGLFNICFKKRFGSSPGRWRKTDQSSSVRSAEILEKSAVCALRTNGLCAWSLKGIGMGAPGAPQRRLVLA